MVKFKRSSGLLLHISALHGEYGIGDLGQCSYDFIDYLHDAKVHLWQLLPLGPTPDDGCPYASYSAFAGNPMLIDPRGLVEMSLLEEKDLGGTSLDSCKVDYQELKKYKQRVLKSAFLNYHLNQDERLMSDFTDFCKNEAYWLDDWAIYAAIKNVNKGLPWHEWSLPLRNRETEALEVFVQANKDQVEFEKFEQFIFAYQWNKVHQYAKEKEVQIVGDIPIYVAHDSADVWSRPENFDLREDGTPNMIAGVPPDYFSETGQLWGNPTYDWEYLKEHKFDWWVARVKHLLRSCDVVRVDHFRAFSTYWAVPYGEETAINGEWKQAPGHAFFNQLKEELGDLPIMAEDLGDIDQAVIDLRDDFDFPGMKILQFAFDSNERNNFLPMYYHDNSVVYTGTHDNDTVLGWFENASIEDQTFALDYLNGSLDKVVESFVRGAWSSVSVIAITTVQDLLKLGEEARFNVPGTVEGNWSWKMTRDQFNSLDSSLLKKLNEVYDRDRLSI